MLKTKYLFKHTKIVISILLTVFLSVMARTVIAEGTTNRDQPVEEPASRSGSFPDNQDMDELVKKDYGKITGTVAIPENDNLIFVRLTLNSGEKKSFKHTGDFNFKKLLPGLYEIRVSVEKLDSQENKIKHEFKVADIRVKPGDLVNIGTIDSESTADIQAGEVPTDQETAYFKELRQKFTAAKSKQAKEKPKKTNEEKSFDSIYQNVIDGEKETSTPIVMEAFGRSLLPGFGQFYNKRQVKGFIFMGAIVLSATGWLIYNLEGKNAEISYKNTTDIKDLINSTTFNKSWNLYTTSNIFLGFAYGIYFISILDAVIDAAVTKHAIEKRFNLSMDRQVPGLTFSLSSSF